MSEKNTTLVDYYYGLANTKNAGAGSTNRTWQGGRMKYHCHFVNSTTWDEVITVTSGKRLVIIKMIFQVKNTLENGELRACLSASGSNDATVDADASSINITSKIKDRGLQYAANFETPIVFDFSGCPIKGAVDQSVYFIKNNISGSIGTIYCEIDG